jgi:hypothetical protein
MQDRMNWLLGGYVLKAYHSPKKYPKKPILETKKKHRVQTWKEAENNLKLLYNLKKRK